VPARPTRRPSPRPASTASPSGLTAEPASLDFTTSDGAAIPEALLYNVVETLVKVDAASGDVVPLLAESYEVSADGPGVRLHAARGGHLQQR
jgi:peptide/nickel transport system substrate-binding protein